MTIYNKQYCIDNNIIIECNTDEEMETITNNKPWKLEGEIGYIVFKTSGYMWQPTYGNRSREVDYFKKNGYYYTESISAQRYLQDNGLLRQTSTFWW